MHAARWIRKVDAFNFNPFWSDGRPSFRGALPTTTESLDVSVKMITTNAVVGPTLPEGVNGLVLQGTGAAHVPSSFFAEIERFWTLGLPVVIASRCRDVACTFNKSDRVLWAGDQTAEKATLSLMAALAVSTQLSDVPNWWSELMYQSVR
jgi:L-asparaginase